MLENTAPETRCKLRQKTVTLHQTMVYVLLGARVVPIHFKDSLVKQKELFGKINGLLLTGGDLVLTDSTTPFMQAAAMWFNWSVAVNQEGDYFPVWGTCQGFEILGILAANDPTVLCTNCYNSWGYLNKYSTALA